MPRLSRSDKRPLITFADFGLALGLPVMWLFAWMVSTAIWARTASFLAIVRNGSRPFRSRAELVRLDILANETLQVRALKQAQKRTQQNRFIELLFYLRANAPGKRSPAVKLTGKDHLDKAHDQGQGTVLWVIPALCSGLATKKALSQSGFEFAHLSRQFHGVSRSAFGRFALNWIIVRPEMHFAPNRLWMDEGPRYTSLKHATERLGNGGCVTISMSRHGAKCVRVPVANGRLELATGAPNLAHKTGAALFPVVTRQTGAFSFDVEILGPLKLSHSAGRAAAISAASHQLAEIVEQIFHDDPGAAVSRFLTVDKDAITKYLSRY